MPNLVFIRHSQSAPLAGVPANQWRLSPEGRRRCAPLASHLIPYHLDLILTSTEPKAIETGELTGKRLEIPCHTSNNLHEHARETAPYFDSQEEFLEKMASFFAWPAVRVFGEETGLEARRRFSHAVDSILTTYPRENIAIVTHGTVLSLFVSQLTGCAVYPFWRGLGMPAIVAFSHPDMELLAQVNEIA